MTKNEARAWAYAITIKSLRRKASALTAADISKREVLTDKQVAKCKEAMRELADKLEARAQRFKGGDDEARGSNAGGTAAAAEGETGERAPGISGLGPELESSGDSGVDR